jgi:hypothetical protein
MNDAGDTPFKVYFYRDNPPVVSFSDIIILQVRI